MRATAIVACAALVAACAPLRPQPPQLLGAEVRVIVFSLPRARLAIDVTLQNPNAYDIALSSVDVALDIEGAPVARATLASPATLAAAAATVVHLEASGDLSAALTGVARALDRGGGPLRYEVVGAATLADGSMFPFRKRGVLAHL